MRHTPIMISLILIVVITILSLGYFSNSEHHQSSPPKQTHKNKNPDSTMANDHQSILPTPDHIVIVIEENHSYHDIFGNANAPYINQLFKQGALFTNAHGVTHPSQPNYLALFSGSSQGVTSDHCPQTLTKKNLAVTLLAQKLSFVGYSEDLPSIGYKGCHDNAYFRKHNPWVNFTNVTSKINQPLRRFPDDYTKLPTVAFVIPNQNHDMHDGTIKDADQWLKIHMASYIQWAKQHNSLFILTWDEDDFTRSNHIPMVIIGQHVKQTTYKNYMDHYKLLRTIEDIYHLPQLGETKKQQPIMGIWSNNHH